MSGTTTEWSKLTEKEKVELLDKLIRKELLHEMRLLLLFMQQMEEAVKKGDHNHFNRSEHLFGNKLLDVAKQTRDAISLMNQP